MAAQISINRTNSSWKVRLGISAVSLIFFLVLAEIGLRLGGYLYLRNLSATNHTPGDTPITILTVGDSYTVGGDGKWEDNYPSQLQALLEKDYPQKYTIINGGICEANSTQTLTYLSSLIKTYSVDMVILLVGAANRFNPIGYDHTPLSTLLSHSRLANAARILWINLKAKMLLHGEERKNKLRLLPENNRVYNKTSDFSDTNSFCNEVDEAEYRSKLNTDPSNVKNYHDLLSCYDLQGQYDQVEMLYVRMMDAGLAIQSDYIALGKNYRKQGKHAEAEKFYLKHITTGTDNTWAYVGLAEHYLQMSKYAEAKDLLDRLVQAGMDANTVYSTLAEYHAKHGEYDQAYIYYTKSLKAGPNSDAYSELAWVNMKLGRFDEATDTLLSAIKAYPYDFSKYYTLLQTFEFQSKYNSIAILDILNDIQEKTPSLKRSKEFQNFMHFLRNRSRTDARTDAWLESDLNKVALLCKLNGIKLIIQNYPYDYQATNKVIAEAARRHNLPLVDNYTVFSKFPVQDKQKYFDDSDHCTPEGYRIMANNIFNIITAPQEDI